MRFIIGLLGSIITMIFFALINYVFELTIHDFMLGWLCCMGYDIGQNIYEEIKKGVKHEMD